jgi:hypothetical protein
MKRFSDKPRKSEKGQGLAETAIISVVAIILLAGTLSLIPLGRARTAATSAALACAELLSQNPDPAQASLAAYNAAETTLKSGWSGTGTTDYSISVTPPGGIGQPGTCQVSWKVTLNFLPLTFGSSTEKFTSRSEKWKAKW